MHRFCLEGKQTGEFQREKRLWAGMFGNFMEEVGFQQALKHKHNFGREKVGNPIPGEEQH